MEKWGKDRVPLGKMERGKKMKGIKKYKKKSERKEMKKGRKK